MYFQNLKFRQINKSQEEIARTFYSSQPRLGQMIVTFVCEIHEFGEKCREQLICSETLILDGVKMPLVPHSYPLLALISKSKQLSSKEKLSNFKFGIQQDKNVFKLSLKIIIMELWVSC